MGPKKNGVIIKILYDVIKEKVFLISLLVTWANVNVLIRRDVTISGMTIERVDCISNKFIISKNKTQLFQISFTILHKILKGI